MEQSEYEGAVARMLAEQEARSKSSQAEMKDFPLEEKEWTVELPVVHHHRERGSSGSSGFAKGQIEASSRGTRHMTHPPDNEKIYK